MIFKKLYTVGFVFTNGNKDVLLVRKLKPLWQAGRLNGIGGKFEPGETAAQCIYREGYEEIGHHLGWDKFCVLRGGNFVCHFFCSHEQTISTPAQNDVGENLVWASSHALPDDVIPNLFWLIPLALDKTVRRPVEVIDAPNPEK